MLNRNMKYYGLSWLIFVIIYNVVVFVVEPILPNYVFTYDARFWIAYLFVMLSFLGNLYCAYIVFKEEDKERFFFNIPLIKKSYITLIIMLISSSAIMLIPDCPSWISTVISISLLGFNYISIIKAKAASDIVIEHESNIKESTSFIKSLSSKTSILVNKAEDQNIKKELIKLSEAIRYSDPVSNKYLKDIENNIETKINELTDAITNKDSDLTTSLIKELTNLIEERNIKCKLLK